MRLPAKNATAPALALVLAIAGALEAGAQGIKEQQTAPPSGKAPRVDTAPARPAASPGPDAGAKAAPLAREVERSVAAPSAAAPTAAAPGRGFHGDGGLGGHYWRGTPFALIVEALPRLPISVTSPAMRALTLEVLTVPAEPRGGSWMAARLAALRAERLYAMGQLEAAEAAFRAAGLARGDPARGPAEIETKLLLRGPGAACAAVAAHSAVRRSLYLERAAIACQAFAGAHASAVTHLGHLRERGFAVGEVFGGLVMAQQPELARPLARIGGADAWSVRLLAHTALPWPEDAMRLAAPALLRAVAASANGPLAVRIGAAERAFLLGAIDRAALVALYGAVRFSRDALGMAARKRPVAYTPAKRALLFQAAVMAADPPARVAILANWWRLARAERGELLAALVTAPLVHDLVPGEEWGENAAAISRVLFQAGDLERALDWYGRLRGTALNDMEAYMRLGAIAQLAETGGKPRTAAGIEAWAAYQRGREAGARRIALMQALAEGLAARRTNDVSAKNARLGESLGAGARSVDRPLADWREIRTAAAAGRQGEAILQMLTALGHDGVARAEPLALGAAVGVLATLGRGAEARRLAVEAALANGF
jgi:hypothetical protein